MNARISIIFIMALAALSLTASSQAFAQRGVGNRTAWRFDQQNANEDKQLSVELRANVLQLREEEKLAHDVYLALSEKHKLPIFSNIASAESRHLAAMKRLIDNYGLNDPITDKTPGEFSSPEFSNLYDELVSTGSKSLLAAYRVGALIEELDIADLNAGTKLVADHGDVQWVYQNLNRGSRNHLRAFASKLKAAGESYEAQHLTQQEFDQIATSPWERGNGRRRFQ